MRFAISPQFFCTAFAFVLQFVRISFEVFAFVSHFCGGFNFGSVANRLTPCIALGTDADDDDDDDDDGNVAVPVASDVTDPAEIAVCTAASARHLKTHSHSTSRRLQRRSRCAAQRFVPRLRH